MPMPDSRASPNFLSIHLPQVACRFSITGFAESSVEGASGRCYVVSAEQSLVTSTVQQVSTAPLVAGEKIGVLLLKQQLRVVLFVCFVAFSLLSRCKIHQASDPFDVAPAGSFEKMGYDDDFFSTYIDDFCEFSDVSLTLLVDWFRFCPYPNGRWIGREVVEK
nr:transcription factor RF2b-like [Ipomoea batatas]